MSGQKWGLPVVTRRKLLELSLIASSAWSLDRYPAIAQPKYPERPIRLIVPFPPGGVYDAIGRPLADRLKTQLGPIVIENMGGAGGSRGAAVAARAQPDGYTLFLGGTGSLVITPIAARRSLYDPIQDFEAISRLAVAGFCFVVHPSLPVRDLKELAQHAKQHPTKLSFGSAGVGSLGHLAGEMFKIAADLPGLSHVPYAGAGPMMNDLIGGHIPLALPVVTGQVLELHRAGKLRMLAVTLPDRLMSMADVPTVVEAGFPDLIAQVFAGMFAPKGTPKAIIEQVATAINATMVDPELQNLYIAAGFEPDRASGPEKMRSFLQTEIVRWKPIVDASGFKLD